MDPQDEAPIDPGAQKSAQTFDEKDFEGHRAHSVFVGVHVPGERRHSHRRHSHKHHHRSSSVHDGTDDERPITPPAQRVQFILGEDADESSHETHPIFSEMEELVGEGEDMEWKETARWIKFEEDVEEGGNRWSKPHVATLSLHSLFELRSLLLNGTLFLDMEATSVDQIADMVLENMVNANTLALDKKDKVREALLRRHRHQHQTKKPVLPIIRSFAEIGRNYSTSKRSDKHDGMKKSASSISMSRHHHSTTDLSNGDIPQHNLQFMRKIPHGSEASNILVGEVDFLDKTISAFIRLSKASIMGDLTEVPVPTRFLFLLLGPANTNSGFHEIGRAMATLMSDEVFHEVAYRAKNRDHILAGIDEFLDAVTVLPPGEWDPSIRIEPPAAVPPQDSRKRPTAEKPTDEIDEEEEEQKLREESGLSRTGRLFGGLINDIKRKAPWYWSDIKDAVSMQCIASWIFLYFACLSPIITFGGLLSQATGRNMAAMESLVSGFVCGVGYGFFSGQPLTILGSTGPVLVFETIVFEFCQRVSWDYMSFRFWIGTWIAVILLILVAIDASALVCYITRFTEENFATLIAFIFIYKAVENVAIIGKSFPINPGLTNISYNCSCSLNGTITSLTTVDESTTLDKTSCLQLNGTLLGDGCTEFVPDVFLMSILLFLGTFTISVILKDFKNSLFFPSTVRQYVSDFAVIIAILSMTMLDFKVGINTPKLEVPQEFKPTSPDRTWIIDPFKNPIYTFILALLPALLGTILIFMDQQITTVIINRKENKLKKGGGYHLDLFVLAILIQICTLMGLPWFVAATVLSINHVNSLKVESECAAPGEKPQFLGVREQRVTHIFIFLTIGLSVFLTPMLSHIPMPVLYGVFLYMGVASLKGLQFFDRILIMFMPNKYQPDYMFLRQVPIRRVHIFTLIQLACLVCLWVIKSFSTTSILFPLMLVVMIGIRKSLDFFFARRELKILDDIMPEMTKRHQQDMIEGSEQDKPIHLENAGNLKISLANGNVMNIPLSAINISEEVNKTGIWKQVNSCNKTDKKRGASVSRFRKKKHSKKEEKRDERKLEKRLSTMAEEDEEEGITIKRNSVKDKSHWSVGEKKSDKSEETRV
nr:sodium bicarbonate cotransporter 3 isoform X7 [Onthophagus taurus]